MVLSMMQLSSHRFLRDIYPIQLEEPRETTYSLTSSNRRTYLTLETKEITAFRSLIEPLSVLRMTSLHAHISDHISWTPQRRFQTQQYSQEQVSRERYYIETMHASRKIYIQLRALHQQLLSTCSPVCHSKSTGYPHPHSDSPECADQNRSHAPYLCD